MHILALLSQLGNRALNNASGGLAFDAHPHEGGRARRSLDLKEEAMHSRAAIVIFRAAVRNGTVFEY